MKFKDKKHVFESPYDQYACRNGQSFEMVKEINEPDAHHDEEVLPMYLIKFPDGHEVEAWPEEVFHDIH